MWHLVSPNFFQHTSPLQLTLSHQKSFFLLSFIKAERERNQYLISIPFTATWIIPFDLQETGASSLFYLLAVCVDCGVFDFLIGEMEWVHMMMRIVIMICCWHCWAAESTVWSFWMNEWVNGIIMLNKRFSLYINDCLYWRTRLYSQLFPVKSK